MSDIFISYRRESALVVDHIHEKLKARFSSATVFLDRMDIDPGQTFPKRIHDELATAKVVLAVIGRGWISVQDERTYRRRIELPEDWVHEELRQALASGAIVIPVIVEGAVMPTREQLPDPIQGLANRNGFVLSIDHLQHDMEKLIDTIKVQMGREKAARLLGDVASTPFPIAGKLVPSALTKQALDILFAELPQWSLVESSLDDDPRFDKDQKRHEIVRHFRFASFLQAIEFMRRAAEPIDAVGHHPRWVNVFKTVIVHYSTWDIGHRPSDRDAKCAYMLEKLYKEFLADSKDDL